MKTDATSSANDDEYISTATLAEDTDTSRSFWDKARVRGNGPPYVLIGNRPRYHRAGTIAWLAAKAIRSTSEGKA